MQVMMKIDRMGLRLLRRALVDALVESRAADRRDPACRDLPSSATAYVQGILNSLDCVEDGDLVDLRIYRD